MWTSDTSVDDTKTYGCEYDPEKYNYTAKKIGSNTDDGNRVFAGEEFLLSGLKNQYDTKNSTLNNNCADEVIFKSFYQKGVVVRNAVRLIWGDCDGGNVVTPELPSVKILSQRLKVDFKKKVDYPGPSVSYSFPNSLKKQELVDFTNAPFMHSKNGYSQIGFSVHPDFEIFGVPTSFESLQYLKSGGVSMPFLIARNQVSHDESDTRSGFFVRATPVFRGGPKCIQGGPNGKFVLFCFFRVKQTYKTGF